MAQGDIRVTPDGEGGWKVTRDGQDRAIRKTDTQAEADKIGRRTAQRDKVEYSLHGRNGQVRKKDSYGNDPRRSKG